MQVGVQSFLLHPLMGVIIFAKVNRLGTVPPVLNQLKVITLIIL